MFSFLCRLFGCRADSRPSEPPAAMRKPEVETPNTVTTAGPPPTGPTTPAGKRAPDERPGNPEKGNARK
jgi:hypothetical protein